MKIASVFLTLGLAIGTHHAAQASVLYSFQQTSLTPSPNAFGNRDFVLTETILITDAELAAGAVIRLGDGRFAPSYNLAIGMDGTLSGTVLGRLDAYDYSLSGAGGTFSGQLVYGDTLIPECALPGCTITGTYQQVAEPGSVGLLGLGLLGLAAARRRARAAVTA